MVRSTLLFVVSAALLSGCAGSRPLTASSTNNTATYSEDLSAVRPTYSAPVVATVTPKPTTAKPAAPVPKPPANTRPVGPAGVATVNRRLEAVLDTIADQNRQIRYAPGFRIQVYVGNDRQQVDQIRRQLTENFPELNPYLSYTQPTYKLKVGDFMRRLDAERYYASVKQLYPMAQLQPDKVDIRRGLLIK